MYVYICDNLMYIIRLCYFPLIDKLYFWFQYYFCLYFFLFFFILFKSRHSVYSALAIYYKHALLIPRKLTWLKSVLFIIIWFLRQPNFSFYCHVKCLSE